MGQSTAFQIFLLVVGVLLTLDFPCALSADKKILALGRQAHLGTLFDARSQSFLDHNLRRPDDAHATDSSPFVQVKNVHFSWNSLKLVRSLKDKFSVLTDGEDRADAEMVVGVTCGEIKIGRSFEFLRFKSLLDGILSNTYLWVRAMEKRGDRWKIEEFGVEREIDFSLLLQHNATHVVTEVTWGGFIASVLKLGGNETIQTLNLQSGAHMNQTSQGLVEESLKIYSDMSIGSRRVGSLAQVKDLMDQLPELILETNGGKGIPVAYTLTPIPDFMGRFPFADFSSDQHDADFIGHQTHPDFSTYRASPIGFAVFRNLETILDKTSVTHRILEEFKETLVAHDMCVVTEDLDRVQILSVEFLQSTTQFMKNLTNLLPQVRYGSKSQSELNDLLSNYMEGGKFKSYLSVEHELGHMFQGAKKKIQFYTAMRAQNIGYLGRDSFFDEIFQESGDKSHNGTYVLYIRNLLGIQSSQSWHMKKAQFLLLKGTNRLWVVDCDFYSPVAGNLRPCHGLATPVIHEYHQGQLTSTNFVGLVGSPRDDKLERLEDQIFNLNRTIFHQISLKLEDVIASLTLPSRARFFTHTNMTGDWEDYNVDPYDYGKGCHTLVARSVMSIETFGSCVRVFSEENCKGSTRALCTGTKRGYENVASISHGIVSVGPCFGPVQRENLPTSATRHLPSRSEIRGPPKAYMYLKENQSGYSNVYNDDPQHANPECYDLDEHLGGRVRSIKTFGTCVIVYERKHCRGRGSFIYTDQNIPSSQTIRSIGPCSY